MGLWWNPCNDNRAAGIVLGVLPYKGTCSLMGIGTCDSTESTSKQWLIATGSGRLAVVDASFSPCSGPCFARGMARFHGPEGRQLMRNVQGTHGK